MSRNNKRTVAILLGIVLLMVLIPLITKRGAEFGGSDDAGSGVVEELHEGYEPWFTPVLETILGGELPGELESLLFCVQTGIGVGILAFFMGRYVERKKIMDKLSTSEAEKLKDML